MPNPHRGEIEACLDGQSFRLCLTLGSLAELEHTFGHEDMLSLAERFQSGRLSARDAQRVIGAGLRGAGHVDIVARLLGATFGGPIVGAVAGKIASSAIDAFAPGEGRGSTGDTPGPFPGAR
jgi:hypothetical protein